MRGPTRIEEIRARVEAAVMGVGLDKFGSAIVDDFGRCVVCGKWTNPGHDDAQSHKDGCAARREEVRYAQALHAIYRAGADDLRHLLHEVAGYQSDLLAGERALKEARRERDTARSAALDAERAFEAMRAERDELLGKRVSRVVYDSVCEERDTLTADLARARRILAVEQGREGPEGWRYDCTDGVWWRKETTGRAWRGWRWVDSGKVPVWRWSCQAQTGYAGAALEALEAADRVLR